jgi:hypothetical protein
MSNSFNQSLLNTNILTSGNSFEDAQFEGDTVFSGTIDMSNITSITGLVDGTSLDEASGVISVKNLGITNSKINDMSVSKLTSGTASGTGAYVISGITLENNNINVSSVSTDTINEKTTNNGVLVDGVLIKDGQIASSYISGLETYNQSLNSYDNVQFAQVSIPDGSLISGGVSSDVIEATAYMSTPATYTNSIRTQSSGDLTIYTLSGNVILNNATYINDSNFYLRNASNNAKIAKWDLAALSAATRTYSLPDSSGIVALTSNITFTESSTSTVSNKTYSCASNAFEQDGSYLKFDVSGMATGYTATLAFQAGGSYTYTFPDVGSSSRTIAYTSGSQTFDGKSLTNASLTGPVITNPTIYTNSGSATITLPTSTQTLVGKTTTDILTNKTLTNPSFTAGTTGVPAMTLNSGSYLTSPTTGAIEYDNLNIYCCNAGGRSIIPGIYIVYCASDHTLNNDANAQSCFAASKDAIALPSASAYLVEGFYIVETGTSGSKTIALEFTSSSGTPTFEYSTHLWGGAVNAVVGGLAQCHVSGIASKVINGANTTAYNIIKLSGIMVASTATTITPKIKFSGAPGITCYMKTGSFLKFTCLGTNSLSSIGPWS